MSRDALMRLLLALAIIAGIGFITYLVRRPTPADVILRVGGGGPMVLCPPGDHVDLQWLSGGQLPECTTGLVPGVACRRAELTTSPDIFHVSGTSGHAMGGNQPLTVSETTTVTYTSTSLPSGGPRPEGLSRSRCGPTRGSCI